MKGLGRLRDLSKNPGYLTAQSAMEYLVTYGWVIVVLSIVVMVLWLLGVFKVGGSSSASFCTPIAPYTCSNPVLFSNGLLSVRVEELGSAMTVSGLGCSSSSVAPSAFSQTNIQLLPGISYNLNFSCNISSNAIGTTFSGSLWVQYGGGSQTGLSQISTVNAKVVASATESP